MGRLTSHPPVKLTRRIFFGVLALLMVAPIGFVGYALLFSHPGSISEAIAAVALPAQAVAAILMLLWCAIFLKIEPGLSRIGILLAALALVLLGLTTSLE